jgi:hypothetical protein
LEHQIALYVLDWDSNDARNMTVWVRDGSTNAVLDTRTVSSFSGGKYLIWNVKGDVIFSFLMGSEAQTAVLSGMFFDAPTRKGPGTLR